MLKLLDYLPTTEILDEQTDTKTLQLKTGEQVRIEANDQAEKVQLVSPKGELIFEFDPISKKTKMVIPEGDLEFDVKSGNIDFAAAGKINIKSEQAVGLEAGDNTKNNSSTIQVTRRKLKLTSPTFGLVSQKANFFLDELKYAGKRVKGTLNDANFILKKMDLAADTIRTRAETVLQQVEGLMQTRVGRMRSLVEKSYFLKGRMLSLKAQKDVKVDGKQILLG